MEVLAELLPAMTMARRVSPSPSHRRLAQEPGLGTVALEQGDDACTLGVPYDGILGRLARLLLHKLPEPSTNAAGVPALKDG